MHGLRDGFEIGMFELLGEHEGIKLDLCKGLLLGLPEGSPDGNT